MTIQEAYARIVEVIQTDYRHPDYDRTNDVAMWGYSMMTGDGQEEYINLRENETDDQKAQRKRLYNSITGLAARQVSAIFAKVRRTDGVKEEVRHDNANSQAAITATLDKFHAAKHLREYLFDRLEYFTFYDPNAWILCERTDTRTEEGVIRAVTPYPLEVSCDQALDFKVENGVVVYLIVGRKRMEVIDNKPVSPWDYYFYHAGFTIHFHEYSGQSPQMAGYEPLAILKSDDSTAFFLYQIFATGSQEFPGMRAGCYADPKTKGRTFWTPLHYAENVFSDLMTDKANADVGRTLHHYPQKYVYAPICRYKDQETGERCEGGVMPHGKNGKCPQCNGKGALYHLGEQDVVVIAYDPDTQDTSLPPLSSFAFYVNLPDWLPKWMAEQIKDGVDRVFSAVFATQIDARQQPGPQTATEVVLDYEQAYSVLQSYSELFSATFEVMARVSADYLELNRPGLTALHRFPKDFKMEGLNELLQKYKEAKGAGVSEEVLASIERDILMKMHRNNPERIANWEAFQGFMPFRDKTPEMVGFILSARAETDLDRILYENFAAITSEIQATLDVWFYLLPFEEQKRLIGEAVQAKIAEIQYASGQFQGSFTGAGGG